MGICRDLVTTDASGQVALMFVEPLTCVTCV